MKGRGYTGPALRLLGSTRYVALIAEHWTLKTLHFGSLLATPWCRSYRRDADSIRERSHNSKGSVSKPCQSSLPSLLFPRRKGSRHLAPSQRQSELAGLLACAERSVPSHHHLRIRFKSFAEGPTMCVELFVPFLERRPDSRCSSCVSR